MSDLIKEYREEITVMRKPAPNVVIPSFVIKTPTPQPYTAGEVARLFAEAKQDFPRLVESDVSVMMEDQWDVMAGLRKKFLRPPPETTFAGISFAPQPDETPPPAYQKRELILGAQG